MFLASLRLLSAAGRPGRLGAGGSFIALKQEGDRENKSDESSKRDEVTAEAFVLLHFSGGCGSSGRVLRRRWRDCEGGCGEHGNN